MTCPATSEVRPSRTNYTWRDIMQTVSISVDGLFSPTSREELVRLIIDAEASGFEVHPVGGRMSLNDCAATPKWMVDIGSLNRILNGLVDNTSSSSALTPEWRTKQAGTDPAPFRLVHVEAGIRLFDFCRTLQAQGLGLLTLGGALGQTLAGAASTSTHGSDRGLPPVTDQILALHLVSTGGQEYWIERRSTPVTSSDDALRSAIAACDDLRIIRDDELFNAAVVSSGRFGIIYAVVFIVGPAMRVAEFGVELNTRDVMNALPPVEDGYFGALERLLDRPPSSIVSGIRNLSSFRYLDIIMNSRNPAKCTVRRRWETTTTVDLNLPRPDFFCTPGLAQAAAGIAGPLLVSAAPGLVFPWKTAQALALASELGAKAADPHFTAGELVALTLNGIWDVQVEELFGFIVDAVVNSVWDQRTGDTRSAGIVGPLWKVSAGEQDPRDELGKCYRGRSVEIVFSVLDAAFRQFVDFLVAEARNHRQSGYIAIRFTHGSDALLSMHRDPKHVSRTRSGLFASVEVTSLAGLMGNDNWYATILRRASELGGRPHWGQENVLSAGEVESLYGPALRSWKRQCTRVVGDSHTFSNAYTRQRGLEPLRSPGAEWLPIGHANEVTAMSAVGERLFAATKHNMLWTREPVLHDTDWTFVGHANNVVAMSTARNVLFAATQSNGLWARQPELRDIDWILVGHANDCVGLAFSNGKLFAATKDNRLWVRDPVLREVNWASIGHANGVVVMTDAGGDLLAVTRDANLWKRSAALRDENWSVVGSARGVVAMASIGARLFAVTDENELWMRSVP